jgi:hypothetical protein
MDKDRGLGFQLGSRSWQADRGQEEAKAHNASVRFHSNVPSFLGGSRRGRNACPVIHIPDRGNIGEGSESCPKLSRHRVSEGVKASKSL